MNPTTAKYIKIGIGVTALAVVGYFLFSKNDNGGSSTTDPTGNVGNPGSADFDARQIALTLFHAMNQIGTDETTIIETLRTVSYSQFQKVIAAFGKERYSDIFGYKTATADERSLPYWLKEELSDSQYANLKRKYGNLLL